MINWNKEKAVEYAGFSASQHKRGIHDESVIVDMFEVWKASGLHINQVVEMFRDKAFPSPRKSNPEQPNKEWEILSWEGEAGFNYNSKYPHCDNDKPLSVKRFSDGLVFAVGDEISIGERSIGKIHSFEIWTGAMLIRTENYFEPIFKISHSPKKETLPLEDMPLLSVNDVNDWFMREGSFVQEKFLKPALIIFAKLKNNKQA